jgi:hypothetical protein
MVSVLSSFSLPLLQSARVEGTHDEQMDRQQNESVLCAKWCSDVTVILTLVSRESG